MKTDDRKSHDELIREMIEMREHIRQLESFTVSIEQIVEEVTESESKYKTIINNMMNGFMHAKIVLDESGKPIDYIYLEINKFFAEELQMEEDEIVGKSAKSIFPDIDDKLIQAFGETSLTGISKQKQIFTAELNKYYDTTIYSPEKEEFYVVFRDITNQKKFESDIKESEKRYRDIFNNAPIGIFQSTFQGKFLKVNPALAQMLGFESPDQVIENQSVFHDEFMLLPVDKADLFDQIKDQEGFKIFETNYKTQHDQFIDALCYVRAVKDNGFQFLEGFILDVSQIKRTEQSLKESEERFRKIAMMAHDAIILLDGKGQVIFWNLAAEKQFGYTQSEMQNQQLHDIIGVEMNMDSLHERIQYFSQTGNGEFIGRTIETVARNKNKEEIQIELSLASMKLKSEWTAIGIIRDISERQKVVSEMDEMIKNQSFISKISYFFLSVLDFEATVEYTLELLRTYLSCDRICIFEDYDDGNHAVCTFEKLNSFASSTKENHPIVTYKDVPSWKKIISEQGMIIAGTIGTLPPDVSTKLYKEDTKSIIVFPIYIEDIFFGYISIETTQYIKVWNQHEIELIKTFSNILASGYERKIYNEKLKESEKKFRNIFNSSSDIIIISDFLGRIKEVNNKATEVLSYSKNELLRLNLEDLIPAEDRDLFENKIASLHEQISAMTQISLKTKSDKYIPFEVSSRQIDYQGENCILSTMRDITERKEIEKRVLSAMILGEEKERDRTSKELHDGLGALLSSINIYVNLILAGQTNDDEKDELLRTIKELVNQTITSAREISNNIRPNVLSNYGLIPSLTSFIEKLNKTGQIEVNFNSKAENFSLEKNIEIIIYRIVNELINNTLKHAQASIIDIEMIQDDRFFHLTYKDNGKGFDVQTKVNNTFTQSMGLSNITSRLLSIGGYCNISSIQGEGMEAKIKIKL